MTTLLLIKNNWTISILNDVLFFQVFLFFNELDYKNKCNLEIPIVIDFRYIYSAIYMSKYQTKVTLQRMVIYVEILGMFSVYHSFLILFSVEILGMFKY